MLIDELRRNLKIDNFCLQNIDSISGVRSEHVGVKIISGELVDGESLSLHVFYLRKIS